jgi:predicted membrane protein
MFCKNILTCLFLILFIYSADAQVGISTSAPEAALDIASPDSGVLFPRIDILTVTDAISVNNPNGSALVEGTMVWNTAVTGIQPAGFYFWQGGTWNQVLSSNQKTVHFGKMIIDASGAKTITGVGFQPSSIEFTAINRVQGYNDLASRGSNDSNDVTTASGQMVGYATNYGGQAMQQVISFGINGAETKNIATYASQNHCISAYFVDNEADAIDDNGDARRNNTRTQQGMVRASLTSFDTDGFTLNVDRFLSGINARANRIVVIFKAYR